MSLALGLLTLVLGTCSPPPEATVDAGRDAGRNEDAGREPDAATRSDAAVEPDAGGANEWLSVPGTEDCLQVATNPSRVQSRIGMQACEGVPRCSELVVDWADVGFPHLRVMFARHLSTGAVLAVRRLTASNWEETLIVRRDGTVEAAFRGLYVPEIPRCDVGPVAVSESRVVFEIVRYAADGAGILPSIVVTAPRTAPTNARVLKAFSEAEARSASQAIDASDEVVGLEMINGVVWRIDADGTAARVSGDGEAHIDAIVGRALFFSSGSFDAPYRVLVSTGGAGQRLVSPESGEDSALRTDGIDMIWQRLADRTGFTFNTIEFWTAPYQETGPVSGALMRSTRSGQPNPFVVFGGGRVLEAQADGSVLVYGLDGVLLETMAGSVSEFADLGVSYSAHGEIGAALSSTSLLPAHSTFRWLER